MGSFSDGHGRTDNRILGLGWEKLNDKNNDEHDEIDGDDDSHDYDEDDGNGDDSDGIGDDVDDD